MIISVGFDGTCVTNDYPKIGKEIGAAEALRTLVKRGHKIVLLTKRWNRPLADAVKWFKNNGVELYGLHATPEMRNEGTRKTYPTLYDNFYIGVHADLYIDARALGCPLIYGDHKHPYVDWAKVDTLMKLRDHGIDLKYEYPASL